MKLRIIGKVFNSFQKGLIKFLVANKMTMGNLYINLIWR